VRTTKTNADIVGLFNQYTEGLPSCPMFREWCGITLVAGAMERRIWTQVGRMQSFANLFVMLVGPAGTGKGVINSVRDLWKGTMNGTQAIFNVGIKSYTKASLVDDLHDAKKTYVADAGEPLIYHSLLLASEEFPVLFPRFDFELLAFMSDIWNCDAVYDERRRTSAIKSVSISYPIINAIMGYQPAVMAQTMPSTAWEQGFMRRTIMIWNGTVEVKSLFESDPLDEELAKAIHRRLYQISTLYGAMKWESKAAAMLDIWHTEGGQPRPDHVRLQSYNNTRSHLAIKLAMIASISESSDMVIREHHIGRALTWLIKAESLMPEIFRSMTGDSDSALITELHASMLVIYKSSHKAIHNRFIWDFLSKRTPSHKVQHIIGVMERAGYIVRDSKLPEMWIPMSNQGTPH